MISKLDKMGFILLFCSPAEFYVKFLDGCESIKLSRAILWGKIPTKNEICSKATFVIEHNSDYVLCEVLEDLKYDEVFCQISLYNSNIKLKVNYQRLLYINYDDIDNEENCASLKINNFFPKFPNGWCPVLISKLKTLLVHQKFIFQYKSVKADPSDGRYFVDILRILDRCSAIESFFEDNAVMSGSEYYCALLEYDKTKFFNAIKLQKRFMISVPLAKKALVGRRKDNSKSAEHQVLSKNVTISQVSENKINAVYKEKPIYDDAQGMHNSGLNTNIFVPCSTNPFKSANFTNIVSMFTEMYKNCPFNVLLNPIYMPFVSLSSSIYKSQKNGNFPGNPVFLFQNQLPYNPYITNLNSPNIGNTTQRTFSNKPLLKNELAEQRFHDQLLSNTFSNQSNSENVNKSNHAHNIQKKFVFNEVDFPPINVSSIPSPPNISVLTKSSSIDISSIPLPSDSIDSRIPKTYKESISPVSIKKNFTFDVNDFPPIKVSQAPLSPNFQMFTKSSLVNTSMSSCLGTKGLISNTNEFIEINGSSMSFSNDSINCTSPSPQISTHNASESSNASICFEKNQKPDSVDVIGLSDADKSIHLQENNILFVPENRNGLESPVTVAKYNNTLSVVQSNHFNGIIFKSPILSDSKGVFIPVQVYALPSSSLNEPFRVYSNFRLNFIQMNNLMPFIFDMKSNMIYKNYFTNTIFSNRNSNSNRCLISNPAQRAISQNESNHRIIENIVVTVRDKNFN